MARVRAATVAMRSCGGGFSKAKFRGGIRCLGEPTSGQMMVVMIEAGTTIPPMPMPARTRRPQTW